MLESVVVLRHAKAGDRTLWTGDDLARPLDPEGLADSLSLPAELAGWPIDEIWTSPAARCQHTVAALAAERRTPVRQADWLLVGSDLGAIRAGLDGVASSVLLCSHREAIPDLLTALGPLPLLDPPVLDEGLDKGAALTLRYDGDTIVAADLINPRRPLAIP